MKPWGPLLVVPVLLAPIGCKKHSDSGPAPASTVTTTATSSAPAPPISQPPIRDNETLGEQQSGARAGVRLFVSKLTPKDPIAVGFRLVPEKPLIKDHPWYFEYVDWSKAIAALVFELTMPNGKVVQLRVANGFAHPASLALADLVEDFALDPTGLTQDTEHLAWKEPAPQLLDALGKYSLAISGTIQTDKQSLEIASKPVEFEVVAHGAGHQSLAEIEAAASRIVRAKAHPKDAPKIYSPTIDDVAGNLWTRFDVTGPQRAYDIDIVEVLLDPSGKELAYDQYQHFTCVAAGTSIATPNGSVPVERLHVGDPVESYDPATGRFGSSRVLQISSSRAERLYALGRLRVTGNHPVFADGRWQLAGEIAAGARLFGLDSNRVPLTPEPVDQPSVVYDLSVTAPHTYFADGLLVHNKVAFVPLGGNQPWRGWFYRRAAKPR